MASDLTGLFFTKDGGSSWEVVPFYQMRATVQSKVWFTSHADTLYTLYNDFENVKQFVYRSDDGGAHWQSVTSDPSMGEVTYLYVDPERTDRLLIADHSTIYFSDSHGDNFQNIYAADDIHIGGVYWDDEKIYLGTRDGIISSSDGSFSSLFIAIVVKASAGVQ